MGAYALGLGPQVLFGGEDHLGSGVFLAKVESDYFAVHQRLDGHQYSYYCCCHERGLLLYMNKVHAYGGTQRMLGVYSNYYIKKDKVYHRDALEDLLKGSETTLYDSE